MKERFKKPVDKHRANSSFVRRETDMHSVVGDSRNITNDTNDLLSQPSVSSSDGSQQRAVTNDRVCRQYQRQRAVLNAASEHDGSISRLGIASNLL